jgi:hypothetical protein
MPLSRIVQLYRGGKFLVEENGIPEEKTPSQVIC